jgi:hypothetical protein
MDELMISRPIRDKAEGITIGFFLAIWLLLRFTYTPPGTALQVDGPKQASGKNAPPSVTLLYLGFSKGIAYGTGHTCLQDRELRPYLRAHMLQNFSSEWPVYVL